MGSMVYLSRLLLELWSWKCQNGFFSLSLVTSLGKIFKCIWKIFLSSFRKCYGLLSSETPLAKCQLLKSHDFFFFSWLRKFFIFLLSIWRTVTRKPTNYTIFWKNSIRSICQVYSNILSTLRLIFYCHQQKIR